ncbi:DUF4373 domain-containing protein [Paenibacillus campinasensis]|uniref:DUF4373 domain-containing protein n=1 Tax=Paenibacillus campinasensis TaxID=66347 RepID=A0ABW9T5Q5_9BACL|nr:DUF4373 domain-containing protein [Paenibacillus campinasensis]MUG68663.1 DUF4373 domain-containing protein [Paenibacillus campinasensis]
MARPLKDSLDYFPLDIDFDQDDKLVVTVSRYGMEGLGVIVKLMGEVYRNGYFYPWTEREHYVFSNRVNVDINLVKEIVNECIKWDFFNNKVYESHGILTSKGFQKRFLEAAKRRKNITMVEEYLLIDPEEECKNVIHGIAVINAQGNTVNVYINPDKCNSKAAETPQSKVKESKGKESTESDNKDLPPEPAAPADAQPSVSGRKGRAKPEYSEDSPYYKMAVYFQEKVEEMAKGEGLTHLTANTNLQSWANDFRLLVEKDKHSDRNLIREVMDWVVTDSFWKSNILSAKAFREKFPKLVIEMRNKTRRQTGGRSVGSAKPKIDVVPSIKEAPGVPVVTDDEMEKYMELARQMSEGKKHA